ncbi:MAG TPA: ABC transporter permease subunit [Candidatus Kapabacteria bacterium]|nr:ABC transporter permease subunit [Candidatus Kapabacteria bacterium]
MRRPDRGAEPGRVRRRLIALLAGMICLAPVAYLLLLSFADRWAFPDLFPGGWRFDLQGAFSGSGALLESFLLSLGISSLVAFVSTLGGFVAARYVAYHRRRRALLFLAYLPFVMSPVILGACIHYLYIRLALAATTAGVIMAQTIFAFGFGIIFFMSFWNNERRAQEQAAMLLGARPWQRMRRVLLPMARDLLLVCFLQTFLFSWFQYGLTVLIGGGTVRTLAVLVYVYIGEANTRYAALSSLLLLVPPVLFLWANKRFVVRYL